MTTCYVERVACSENVQQTIISQHSYAETSLCSSLDIITACDLVQFSSTLFTSAAVSFFKAQKLVNCSPAVALDMI